MCVYIINLFQLLADSLLKEIINLLNIMKYKKHIATGALALSLLVGSSSVFAATPQDLGIKNVQLSHQKQNKSIKNSKIERKDDNVVGVISAMDTTGFTVDVKNLKTKISQSIEVKTDASTIYHKNGITALPSELISGQKVIIVGSLDKTSNIMLAKQVKIVTNKVMSLNRVKKENKKVGMKVDPKIDANNTVKAVQ